MGNSSSTPRRFNLGMWIVAGVDHHCQGFEEILGRLPLALVHNAIGCCFPPVVGIPWRQPAFHKAGIELHVRIDIALLMGRQLSSDFTRVGRAAAPW